MRKYQQKKKVKSILGSRLVLVVVSILTLLLLSSSYGLYTKKKRVATLRDQAKNELSSAEEKTVVLDGDIAEVDSPHGREKIMRQKFNIKKPGEEVIVVTDPEKEDDDVVVKKGVFESWTDTLSKLFD